MKTEMEAARDAAYLTAFGKSTDPRDLANKMFDAGWNARGSQWVAVKDDLPILSAVYYVTLSNGLVGRSSFYCGAFDRSVIAWMPVPREPYTADSGQEGE